MALSLAFCSSVIARMMKTMNDHSYKTLGWPSLKKENKRLTKLRKIRDVLEAAEENQTSVPDSVVGWLLELKADLEKADDVLDDIDDWRLERSVKSEEEPRTPKTNQVSSFDLLVKDERSIGVFRKILGKVPQDVLKFLESSKQHRRPTIKDFLSNSTSPIEETEEFIQTEEMDLAVRSLTTKSTNDLKTICILPIVGMAGTGKTTLAQSVFSDRRIKKYFSLSIWVSNSNDFNVVKLSQKIIESAFHEKADSDSLEHLQKIIIKKLKPHRFLLILDDVNYVDKQSWLTLIAPLRFGSKGSKILLTTQDSKTVQMIKDVDSMETIPCGVEHIDVKKLNEGNNWMLLKKYAFSHETPNNFLRLETISKEIVRKCKGSPLAAKVIAGVLRCKLDEDYWSEINRDVPDIREEESSTPQIVAFCYSRLPQPLRLCFSFCGIFPYDYEFSKVELVEMWIAAGLIPYSMEEEKKKKKESNEKGELEDEGEVYFDELVRRSFFQKSSTGACTTYKMHNLLTDLASKVSSDLCFKVVANDHQQIPSTVRHLAIETSSPKLPEEVLKLKNLRTLLFNRRPGQEINSIIDEIASGFPRLCILSLKAVNLKELPSNIGNMKHLRFLDLSECSITLLDGSVGQLYHLRFLKVAKGLNESGFYKFPHSLTNLVNLRHLIGLPRDMSFVGIGKLSSLQELDCFSAADEDGCNLEELQNLKQLRMLTINNLRFVQSYEEADSSELASKQRLAKLTLDWGDTDYWSSLHDAREIDIGILEALRPPPKLQELTIRNFTGPESPSWMTGDHFTSLSFLWLEGCWRWKELPLGELPTLKVLGLRDMQAVQRVYHGTKLLSVSGKEVPPVFPSLEVLYVLFMEHLQEWNDEKGCGQWFPRLRKLKIEWCPQLRELPPLPAELEDIEITGMGLTALPPDKDWLKIKELRYLKISSCNELRSLGGLEKLHSLKTLEIQACPKLWRAQPKGDDDETSGHNTHVSEFDHIIIDEPSLLQLPALEGAKSIRMFTLLHLYGFTSLPKHCEDWLNQITSSLKHLALIHCESLCSLPESLAHFASLETLWLDDVPKLQSLPGLPNSVTVITTGMLHPKLEISRDRKNEGSQMKEKGSPHSSELELVKEGEEYLRNDLISSAEAGDEDSITPVRETKPYPDKTRAEELLSLPRSTRLTSPPLEKRYPEKARAKELLSLPRSTRLTSRLLEKRYSEKAREWACLGVFLLAFGHKKALHNKALVEHA